MNVPIGLNLRERLRLAREGKTQSQNTILFSNFETDAFESLKEKITFLNRCAIQYHITNVEGTQQLFRKEMLYLVSEYVISEGK